MSHHHEDLYVQDIREAITKATLWGDVIQCNHAWSAALFVILTLAIAAVDGGRPTSPLSTRF